MISLTPIDLSAAEKLSALRRLDHFRQWRSLADKRHCLQCGEIVTGHAIDIVGGTRGLGPLRMQCPTPRCPGIAIDMALPEGTVAPIFGDGSELLPETAHAAQSGPTGALNRRKRFSRFLRALRLSGTAGKN